MLPFSPESPLTFLITGASGQDGRIAAELLIGFGQRVVGLHRQGRTLPASDFPVQDWVEWDWKSTNQLESHLRAIKPDVCLHLAAHHHSSTALAANCINDERVMFETNLQGAWLIISSLQKIVPDCKFVAALSSQMFHAEKSGTIVSEMSPVCPSTYYAVTKAGVWEMVKFQRRAGRFNGGCAILFNHESRFRAAKFVTRYISQGVAAIKAGRQESLSLRNTGAVADWCSADDAVRAMLLMAAQERVGDFVIASGKGTTLKSLLDYAFSAAGLSWTDFVVSESDVTAPYLLGDNRLAQATLGWEPKLTMEAVMADMVKYDCQ